MKNNFALDKSLLKSIISCSCGLVPVGALIIYLICDHPRGKFNEVSGFIAGSVLGLANMYFLIRLIVSVVTPDDVSKKGAATGLAGISATVFAMLLLAWKHWVGTIGFTAGFTVALTVLLISAFSIIKKNL